MTEFGPELVGDIARMLCDDCTECDAPNCEECVSCPHTIYDQRNAQRIVAYLNTLTPFGSCT